MLVYHGKQIVKRYNKHLILIKLITLRLNRNQT